MNAAKESSSSQSQTQTPTPTQQSTPTTQKQTTPPPPSTPTAQVAHSRSSPAPQPSTPQVDRHSQSSSDFLRHQPPPPAFRPPPEFHSPFFPNGNGLFRPGFPPAYQHPAHHHPTVLSHSPITQNSVQNGMFI